MAEDMFAAVRAAEAKAEQVVSEARQALRERVKEAEAACVERERTAARENRALYQGMLEEKRQTTQKALDTRAQDEKREIERQMAKARTRLPQAVKYIAERVMNDGNR